MVTTVPAAKLRGLAATTSSACAESGGVTAELRAVLPGDGGMQAILGRAATAVNPPTLRPCYDRRRIAHPSATLNVCWERPDNGLARMTASN